MPRLFVVALLLLALFASAPSRAQGYGIEDSDWGVAPTRELRFTDYHAPTPRAVPGAKTIATDDLLRLMQKGASPLLIDVLGGGGHDTLKGARWWRGAGLASRTVRSNVETQLKFKAMLDEASGGKPDRMVVFFCLSAECWLSYNAALRAVEAGYGNVFWYRGGIEAWKAAGNDLERVTNSAW